jgi:hypothetical protein
VGDTGQDVVGPVNGCLIYMSNIQLIYLATFAYKITIQLNHRQNCWYFFVKFFSVSTDTDVLPDFSLFNLTDERSNSIEKKEKLGQILNEQVTLKVERNVSNPSSYQI